MSASPISDQVTKLCLRLFPNGGTYLEAGAHDGIFFSNTTELEESGLWQGILVEPSPVAFDSLIKNRPNNHLLNCALVDSESKPTISGTFLSGSPVATVVPDLFYVDLPAAGTLLSVLRAILYKCFRLRYSPKLIEVPARTLESILETLHISNLDVLILDVEGYELEALTGLGDMRPSLLIVETRTHQALAMSKLLSGWGYVLCYCLSNFHFPERTNALEQFQDLVWIRNDHIDSFLANTLNQLG